MSKQIDLNSDIGELEGEEGRALDEDILTCVTSCNIACGGHAGDAVSMRATVKAAQVSDVLIGAHPSYPDHENFGRMTLDITEIDLAESLCDQIEALRMIAADEGAVVTHVKPHGALYNDAAKNADLSELICKVVKKSGIKYLFGPPLSALSKAAQTQGLTYIAEGFVDRAYEADGALRSRQKPGAVFHELADMEAQAILLASGGKVAIDNRDTIPLPVQTLCLHGDTPGAAEAARSVRAALLKAGVEVSRYA